MPHLKEIEDVKKEDKGEEREWKFEKELRVSKLAYHYPDAEENVLDGADFSIRRGETVAFIGSSGARQKKAGHAYRFHHIFW